MSVKRRDLPADPEAAKIVKVLDQIVVATGWRPDQVFEDWLAVCEATLSMIPLHARAIAETSKLSDDPPEVVKLWSEIKSRYDRYNKHGEVFKTFSEALALLILSAHDTDGTPVYKDLLGEIYMVWCFPNAYIGQVFTPMNIAKMMAQLTADEDEVYKHLQVGYEKSEWGKMHAILLESVDGNTSESNRISAFVRELGGGLVKLCAEHIQPITVLDPCCGSGVMLLAAAETYPVWAIQSGLVQFYGVDLDLTCIHMCRINLMLRGIDPRGITHGNSLSMQLLSSLPQPYRMWYSEAQAAQEAGDIKRVEEIAVKMRAGGMSSAEQLFMFADSETVNTTS